MTCRITEGKFCRRSWATFFINLCQVKYKTKIMSSVVCGGHNTALHSNPVVVLISIISSPYRDVVEQQCRFLPMIYSVQHDSITWHIYYIFCNIDQTVKIVFVCSWSFTLWLFRWLASCHLPETQVMSWFTVTNYICTSEIFFTSAS